MPADAEDLSWTKQPSVVDSTPGFNEIAATPAVPRGHTLVNEVQSYDNEEYSPVPDRIYENAVWFFPALVYCIIGVNKSLFELYKQGCRTSCQVRTFRAQSPLVRFTGMSLREDTATFNWLSTVQCVPLDHGKAFMEYMETFDFRGPPGGVNWKVKFTPVRMADPFFKRPNGDKVGVDIYVGLPQDITNFKQIAVVRESGFRLDPPYLGVIDTPFVRLPILKA